MTSISINHSVVPLDPDNPATWRNHACPVDLKPIQDALTKAGGLNPHGEPNFIIVWGQEYKTWENGKMRIHFSEDLVDPIHMPNRFAVRPEVFGRASAWLRKQKEVQKQAFLNCDWNAFNDFPDISKYLKQHENSADYIALPSDEKDMARLGSLLPPGWQYISGLWDHEFVGQQCFYVIQWLPTSGGTPKREWEKLRFGRSYFPETDQDEDLIDILGPYPSKGSYDNVCVRIGEKRIWYKKNIRAIGTSIPKEYYSYKTPTIENTVNPVKELLKIRDRLTSLEKSPEYRERRREDEFIQNNERDMEKWRQELRKMFHDAAPVGYGNPTNISSNKGKFDN